MISPIFSKFTQRRSFHFGKASKKLYEDDNNDEDRTCTFMANVFSSGDTMAGASMPVAVAEVCLLLFGIANKHIVFF